MKMPWVLISGMAAVAALVVAGNLAAAGVFIARMAKAPLRVEPELVALRRIEAMDDVRAVNLLVPDMWSRLWANALLLRKPQYFPTHTYEGRLNTPLRGEWDLESSVISVDPGPDRRREVSPHFALVDARAPAFIRPFVADGWNQAESTPGSLDRWQWTQGTATLRVEAGIVGHVDAVTERTLVALAADPVGEHRFALALPDGDPPARVVPQVVPSPGRGVAYRFTQDL